VTDRARLDSLFLDEGFGTLDQETLGVVVDAIEQLAGDGRLVGVITHVRDLAEQFPRIEVEKSRRGSSARPVA
jgi:DNA repair protein SbcC/Rad50